MNDIFLKVLIEDFYKDFLKLDDKSTITEYNDINDEFNLMKIMRGKFQNEMDTLKLSEQNKKYFINSIDKIQLLVEAKLNKLKR